MARKYMERRFSKSHRTTIPASFKIPEPSEFYNKATPFVQRTLLFVADENSGPKPSSSNTAQEENLEDVKNTEAAATSKASEAEQEKSPKKSSFFFSPSKSCKLHRNFFRTSPKKAKPENTEPAAPSSSDIAAGGSAQGAGGLISYAPGWSLKGEHLMKWQASGKTTVELVLAALVALAAGKPSAPGYYPGYSSVAYPAAPVAYSSPVYSPPVAYASPVSYASQVAYRAPFTYSAPSYTAPVAYSPAYPAAPVAYPAAPVAYPAAPVAYSATVASVPVAYSPVTYPAAPVKAPVYGAAYAPYAGYYLKK